MGVHKAATRLYLSGDGNGSVRVLGPGGRGETEIVVLRHGDGVRFIIERDQWQDGTELLLADDRQGWIGVDHKSRALEVSSALIQCCVWHLAKFLHVLADGTGLGNHVGHNFLLLG